MTKTVKYSYTNNNSFYFDHGPQDEDEHGRAGTDHQTDGHHHPGKDRVLAHPRAEEGGLSGEGEPTVASHQSHRSGGQHQAQDKHGGVDVLELLAGLQSLGVEGEEGALEQRRDVTYPPHQQLQEEVMEPNACMKQDYIIPCSNIWTPPQ